MKQRNQKLIATLCFTLALVVPTAAMAENSNAASTPQGADASAFPMDKFEPLYGQGANILNVGTSSVLQHLKPTAGLFFQYEYKPIRFAKIDRQTGKRIEDKDEIMIEHQVKGDVALGFGFFNYVDLGVSLPVTIWQKKGDGKFSKISLQRLDTNGGDDGFQEFGVLGDLRVTPKVRILNPEQFGGFGMAVQGTFYLPIPFKSNHTDFQSFSGYGNQKYDGYTWHVEPRLVLDWRHDSGFIIAANVGYQVLRNKYVNANGNLKQYASSDALSAYIGTQIPLGLDWMHLIGTVWSEIPLDKPTNLKDKNLGQMWKDNAIPVEWTAALQFDLPYDLVAQVGGGGSIVSSNVGSPWARAFLGLAYTPRSSDKDGDGVNDDNDKCPEEPEDIDGFEDEDGCPDLDNDQDTLLDEDDACPDEAGPAENNGCPWGDRDGDGVVDNVDKCPDVTGLQEYEGCPDSDGDGIADSDDKCPNEVGPAENNGCPWGDHDGDGILDNVDKCPNDPEDIDGYKDKDGCPDLDNDNDGIPDTKDNCPDKPETYNGVDDEDGCPDKGKTKVRVTNTKIEILEKVFFATGKSKIRSRSFNLLDQVAAVLKNYVRITKVRIEGHTDSVGSDKRNLRLSQERADSVRTYLIDRGVNPGRLVAQGFGEERPIDSNKTRSGRARNRRVEFTIIELDGKPVSTDSVTIRETERVN